MAVYTSLQSYWRRRAYERLETLPSSASANKRILRLGGSGSKGKKSVWRVGLMKKVLRIRVRIPSPKKLMLQMRDAYVNAMLVLAGGVPSAKKSSSKVEAVWGRRIPKAREVAVKSSSASEFEMRMILHIYDTVMSNPRGLTSCA